MASAPSGGRPCSGRAAAGQGLSSTSKEARGNPEPRNALLRPRGSASQKPVHPGEVKRHAWTTGPGLRPHYNPQSPVRRCCTREAVTERDRQGEADMVAIGDDALYWRQKVTRGQGLRIWVSFLKRVCKLSCWVTLNSCYV